MTWRMQRNTTDRQCVVVSVDKSRFDFGINVCRKSNVCQSSWFDPVGSLFSDPVYKRLNLHCHFKFGSVFFERGRKTEGILLLNYSQERVVTEDERLRARYLLAEYGDPN